MSWPTKSHNGTKHSVSCSRVWKNYDMNCPRCIELAGGSKPRSGWNDGKKAAEAQRSAAIATFFAPGGEYSRMTDVQKMCCTRFES